MLQQGPVDLDELAVVVRLEQLGGKRAGSRQAAAVHGLDHELGLRRLHELGFNGSSGGSSASISLRAPARVAAAGVEQLRLAEEAERFVAVLRLERARPALVLLEQAVELLPAPLAELRARLPFESAISNCSSLSLSSSPSRPVPLSRCTAPLPCRCEPERRLRDVHVPRLDQLRHLAVEERQRKRSDMRSVDVGVRRQHHQQVGVLEVELFPDPVLDRRHCRLDLDVREHLVDAALLDVDDLPAQRQHRLGRAVARLLRRAARSSPPTTYSSASRGSLTVQSASFPGRVGLQRHEHLAARQVAGLARGLAGSCGVNRLGDDPCDRSGSPRGTRAEPAVDRLSTAPLTGGLSSLVFVWPSNWGSWSLTEDQAGRQALAHVLAGEIRVLFPSAAPSGARTRSGFGERGLEAGQMGAALMGVDVVREAEDRLLVRGRPLHRDLDLALVAAVLEVDGLAVERVLGLVQVLDEVDDPAL